MKRSALYRALFEEMDARRDADNLLSEAQGQLAASVLREEAAEQLRMVFERAAAGAEDDSRRLAELVIQRYRRDRADSGACPSCHSAWSDHDASCWHGLVEDLLGPVRVAS